MPRVVVRPLSDYVARVSVDGTKVYIDTSAPKKIYRALTYHDLCQWILIYLFKVKPRDVEENPAHDLVERVLVEAEGMTWDEYNGIVENCMRVIKAREPKPENPDDTLGKY